MNERLEEILKESPFNQHTEEFLIKLEDMNEITKIVQELEETVEDYKAVNKKLHQRGRKVRKQNKRYRERIEYMLEEAKDHKRKGLRIRHWALIKDLEETLEGEG